MAETTPEAAVMAAMRDALRPTPDAQAEDIASRRARLSQAGELWDAPVGPWFAVFREGADLSVGGKGLPTKEQAMRPTDPTFLGVISREWLGGTEAMRAMDDPDLDPLKAVGAPVLLLYPADTLPGGKPLPAAWLIDRWSEPGWQHRSARWADPVGWLALPATPPARRRSAAAPAG